MADKENESSSTNAPATEAPDTDAPATVAPVIDAAPADTPSTEATDAAPTAPKLTKPQKKAQKQKNERERMRAAHPTPIPTPFKKIVAVNPDKNLKTAGLVGRVKIDNSHRKGGQVEILDSNGKPKKFYPGHLVEVEQKEKDAFERKEKESGGEPYYLGDDDDASESDDDEALDEPPVAKGAKVEELHKTNVYNLLRHVEGSYGQQARFEKAAYFVAVLADASAKKADERAALIASIDATLKNEWAKYEKHRADHPGLYPEEEAEEEEEEEEDYSDVNIDHLNLAPSVKEGQYANLIKKCVAKGADLSSVEAKFVLDIRKSDFTEALRVARGESRDEQRSPRLAGEVAPKMPTISQPGESVVYSKSTSASVICDAMVEDATTLVNKGTLVPTSGSAGCALRGGFCRGVGSGNAFRIVSMGGPGFRNRFDNNAVYESDPVGSMLSSLNIDLESCFKPSEWVEVEPRLVYASNFALESLPDGASVKDRAKAVYEAYYWVVEKHEHEAVWKSTFKAPGLFRTG